MGRTERFLLHHNRTGKLSALNLESPDLEIRKSKKTALLFGATGLVGGFCLEQLLQHPAYACVRTLSRSPVKRAHPKLEAHTLDLNELENSPKEWFEANDCFICLGTTRAKAGSKEGFFRVDFHYSLQAARLAATVGGANQLLLVSSVGANEGSPIYYTRVKGQIERAVKELPYWSVHLFRPSLLLGERVDNRWGEDLAKQLSRGISWLTGSDFLNRYRPIEAEYVAQAMINSAQSFRRGVQIYEGEAILEMARVEIF